MVLGLVPMFMLASCGGYDDTPIKQDLASLEERITALETVRSDIDGIKSVVSNVQKGFLVTDVSDTAEGWLITFTSGETVLLRHGRNGNTPVVAVRKDTDGIFYWTIDGEWLLDDSGAKVSVTGKDGATGGIGREGVTPQLDIRAGWWVVSLDGGATWKQIFQLPVGGASEGETEAVSVRTDDAFCYITVGDGEPIVIPLELETVRLQLLLDESAFSQLAPGKTVTCTYTLVAAEGVKVSVETMESGGLVTKLTPTGPLAGTLSITAPEGFTSGKVLVTATADNGESVTVVLRITYVPVSGEAAVEILPWEEDDMMSI